MKYNVTIQLDKNSKEPMYVQLYKVLKELVEKGEFKHNEKLPPIRKIAAHLGVNNVTVINAYKLLENSGYAFSRVGSGTYALGKGTEDLKPETKSSILQITEPGEVRVRSGSINFADSSPDPKLLNIEDFKLIMNEVLDRDGGNAFSYTEIRGYRPLRECIAEYMEENGIICSGDSIQIISGAQQGIDIIAKALIDYEDIIITERPTYTGAVAVFKSRGARIIDVPVGKNGINTRELGNRLSKLKPKFIYVMTNFQNPTGYSYSDSTKEELLYLASKHDFYIIEDDYLSELNYSRKKTLTIKSIDENDRVIFVKSFSKMLMPGMRIGFLIVPEKIQTRIAAAKQLSDISTSGFLQRVFELYIRRRKLENHVEYVKRKYSQRYKIITDLIDHELQDVEYYKPEGGVHLWLKTPDSMSSNILYSECIMNKIIVSPGTAFFMDEKDSQYFRICYASTDIDDISRGIGSLKDVMNGLSKGGSLYKNIPIL